MLSTTRGPRRTVPLRSAVACRRFKGRDLNRAQTNCAEHYKEGNFNKVQQHGEEKQQRKERSLQASSHVSSVRHQRFNALRVPTESRNEKHRKQYLYGIQQISHIPPHRHHHHLHQSKGQTDNSISPQHGPQRSPVVVPQTPMVSKTHQATERMKDSRLRGADLYVARLRRTYKPSTSKQANNADGNRKGDDSSLSGASTTESRPVTGSLHDELTCPMPTARPQSSSNTTKPYSEASATHSRPCKQID